MSIPAREQQELDEAGFLVLEGFFDGELLQAIEQRVADQFAAEGPAAGAEFKQEAGCRRCVAG